MNADVVYIVNTQPRLLHLPDEVKELKDRDGKMVRNVIPNGRTIAPSVARGEKKDGAPIPTKVDRAYWERAKKYPTVRDWLRLGWLKVSDIDESGEDMPASLMGYNVRTAITLIEGETNKKLLEEWAATETRPEVKAAIEARLPRK